MYDLKDAYQPTLADLSEGTPLYDAITESASGWSDERVISEIIDDKIEGIEITIDGKTRWIELGSSTVTPEYKRIAAIVRKVRREEREA